ncbi:MAG: SGNH/GDSL hydrolase family protein [Cyclobacteriaceae bacterium]|nr:SGNH/GDSL hydrolase family protein [Cyclobacteriaceae bacterium SS2]
MKSINLSLLLLPLTITLLAQPYDINKDVKKILFLGNSITQQGDYISFIEAYYTLKYPDHQLEFINVGLSSETVSGLSEPNHANGAFPRPDLRERLHRVLDMVKPDLILACYGMNDGIYLPFGMERFQKYQEGIQWLNSETTQRGIDVIFVTPPIYDEAKGAAYANVLDIYADWLISTRYTEEWKVIDIHVPMKRYLDDRRKSDSTFYLAKDGVHPGELGHWLMAREILMSLGESQLVNMEFPTEAFSNYQNSQGVLKLVREKQSLMKYAWLSHTKHLRPGVQAGLPMKEAEKKKRELEKKIKEILK